MIGLEYILKLKQISSRDFADLIGVDKSTVYSWISGKRFSKDRMEQFIKLNIFEGFSENFIRSKIKSPYLTLDGLLDADKIICDENERIKNKADLVIEEILDLFKNSSNKDLYFLVDNYKNFTKEIKSQLERD